MAMRKIARAEMWRQYKAFYTNPHTGMYTPGPCNGVFGVSMSYLQHVFDDDHFIFYFIGQMEATALKRSHFYALLNDATSGQQKVLTGLDNISQRYGNENFEDLRQLVRRICDMAPHQLGAHVDSLISRIDAYQTFLKTELAHHLQTTAPIAAHCLTRLLGGMSCKEADSCHECHSTAQNGKCKPSCRQAQCAACLSVISRGKCRACSERLMYCSDCPESCGDHSQHCSKCDEFYAIYAEVDVMIKIAASVGVEPIVIPGGGTSDLDLFKLTPTCHDSASQPEEQASMVSASDANQGLELATGTAASNLPAQGLPSLAQARLDLLEDFKVLAKRYMARTEKYVSHLIRARVEEVRKPFSFLSMSCFVIFSHVACALLL